MFQKKPRVFVTGGNGYIGSRWRKGTHGAFTIETMQGRIPDIAPEQALTDVDVVVHLAAVTPSEGVDSAHYKAINTEWTTRLGNICAKRGVKLLFVSTASIYADSEGAPLTEDTTHIHPTSTYAESKWIAEIALKNLASAGLPLTVLRFGSVFGSSPRTNFDRVVNKFVRQAFQNHPLTVRKDALSAVRPYTYVGDCAAAIDFVIENDVFDGVYNVVSEHATLSEIVEKIRQFFPQLTIALEKKHHDASFSIDGSKIALRGFSVSGTLDVGIKEVTEELTQK